MTTAYNKLINYIKITKISLEQDLAKMADAMDAMDIGSKDFADMDFEYNYMSGQVSGLLYILNYVDELDASLTKGME
jgi:hypothetical protein